ncbi:MAG TPA: ABC transporter permease, partial [Candidatus Acidoferrum sp.]|nr:ABC transporter permease [Candidatus Acidoferrum sp.]
MSLLRNLAGGLRGLFRKEQVEREMDEELRGYLDAAVNEKIRRGMSREEALRAARIEMGGAESVKEQVRAVSWESLVGTLWQDLKFGLRLLRFNPAFAAAAVLSLALGIGANTAIFQLLDAIRMRTLPVKNPQELAEVRIAERNGATGAFVTRYPKLTSPQWEQIRAQQRGFSGLFAWGPTTFNISPGGEVHNVQGLWVSGEFFDVLGIEPERGRLLSPPDDRPGCASPGVVISHSFWQREFGGDASALGRKITVEKHPFEVIGVTPASFYGVEVGRNFDVALPLCVEPIIRSEFSVLNRRDGWWLTVMGRLKPGWTPEQVSVQARTISPGVFEATLPAEFDAGDAKHYLGYKLGVFPADTGVSELRSTYENPLWLMLGLAALVLLIASANLANLMLARASTREREMAMRMAVGATRGRLIRQLLAESLLLGLSGAVFGALLANGLTQLLVASISTSNQPLFVDLALDWRMLGFTTAITLLTCALFGLTPALRATQVAPGAILKSAGRNATNGPVRFGLRRVLVVSQIAMSLMLVVGALLFGRSLQKLATLDAGFTQDGVLEMDLDLTALHLPSEGRAEFKRQVLDQVRAIPGVESAAEAGIVPLSGDGMNRQVLVNHAGQIVEGKSEMNEISPKYFATWRTPILAGRDFDEGDTLRSPLVALVNETFAKKYLGGVNPVGATFRVKSESKETGPYQIVGLVKDAKLYDLREDFLPTMFMPVAQKGHPEQEETILIRSEASLFGLISSLKSTVQQFNRGIDMNFTPYRKMVETSLLRDRLMARLSGFFGILAVLLATVGLYGVIAYMVERRTSEIGIRMALGADRGSIVRLVLREALVLLGLGLLIGTGLSLAGSRAA